MRRIIILIVFVVNLPPFTNKNIFADTIIVHLSICFIQPCVIMPVCDICCEELPSEAEMRTHLLLSHTENVMACPFCSLSGVSYDELNFHINTAHIEQDCQDMNATVVDSGQKSSNDWITQSHNSTRTSIVKVKNMDSVSQALPQSQSHVNGMATPITGTSLSHGTSASLKCSPPAAATANGAVKLVRTAQKSSNNPSKEREDGWRKSKQKRLSSPIKGALEFTA